MMNDKDRLFDENERSFAISHNLQRNSIEEWDKQFRKNENFRLNRRKDSVIATHEMISFSKEDAKNISIDKMEDMSREYIKQRNPNGMYVAVPHFDKEHYHIHLCVSGIEYRTGKGMRLGKKELQMFKQKIQEYQIEKYPELSKSVVKHGVHPKEPALSDREYRYKMRTGGATKKEQIEVMIKTCYKSAISKEDFYSKINECGLATYIRGGKITGVIHENKKYRFKGLGFTEKSIDDLNRAIKRNEELNKLREKGERNINRNR
jgi:hypothetical protein